MIEQLSANKLEKRIALNSAPKNLAVVYAKAPVRDLLRLLLLFDERLGLVVQQSNEAIVGQMRMAWWRDVIAKDAGFRPTGEPLISLFSSVEAQIGEERTAHAMTRIVDAWDLLLAEEEWRDAILLEHANLRSSGIFGAFCDVQGAGKEDEAKACGCHWSLLDLANLSGCDIGNVLDNLPVAPKLPANLRPLSLLLMAAKQQNLETTPFAGFRLAWHGLTGL